MIAALSLPLFAPSLFNRAHILISLFKRTLAAHDSITARRDQSHCLFLLDGSVTLLEVICSVGADTLGCERVERSSRRAVKSEA